MYTNSNSMKIVLSFPIQYVMQFELIKENEVVICDRSSGMGRLSAVIAALPLLSQPRLGADTSTKNWTICLFHLLNSS